MMPTVAKRLSDVQPQMLRAASEGDRKDLGEPSEGDRKRAVGQSVERALLLVGLTKQDAAFQMGYSDQGTLSRWCSGVERPLFDKLFQLAGFKGAWIIALAEGTPGADVETVVRIRKAG